MGWFRNAVVCLGGSLLFLVACDPEVATSPDGQLVDGGHADAGHADAGHADAGCVVPSPWPACSESLVPDPSSIRPEPWVEAWSQLGMGPATVQSITTSEDGPAILALEQAETVVALALPAAPALSAGDSVEVEAIGTGLTLRAPTGELAVVVGMSRFNGGSEAFTLDETFRAAANEMPATVLVGGEIEAQLGGYCTAPAPHHSRYCDEGVGVILFSLEVGDTVIAPGTVEEATLADGTRLSIANRSTWMRDDRFSDDPCGSHCGDGWAPSLGVVIVLLPAASS
jgi:hypothetical protein